MESILSLLTNSQTEIAIIKKEDFELNEECNSRTVNGNNISICKEEKIHDHISESLLETEINLEDVITRQQIVEEPTNPSLLFFVSNLSETRQLKKEKKNFKTRKKPDVITSVFKCNKCEKSFSKHMYLLTHSLKHQNQRSFECLNCKQRFKHKASLSMHMKSHISGKYPQLKQNPKKKLKIRNCEKCNKNFQTRQSYEAHCFMHNGQRPYKCNQCPKSFLYKHTLGKHISNHISIKKEKKFKCDKCEKLYEFKSELIRHYAHHSDDKAWLCTICGKAYALQATLKTHLKTHSPNKAYECDVCGRTFMKKLVLEIHIKKIHNEESPTFMCDRCPNQFYSNHGLKQHMMIHSDEKKVKCDICSRYFLKYSRFLDHRKKIHNL